MTTFLAIYLVSFISTYFLICVPIHEFGHFLGGILSGYRFLSYRVYCFVWFKENDRLRFSVSKMSLVAGQCLMAPPTDESRFKHTLYNLGGGLLNLLCVVPATFALVYAQNDNVLAVWLGFLLGSVTLGLANLLPMGANTPNDGKNALTANKSDAAKHGLYLMLLTNAEMMDGKRYRDYSEDFFKADSTVTNYLEAFPAMCESARLSDLGQEEAAVELYDTIDIDSMPLYYRNAINADKLYYYITVPHDYDRAKEIYGDKKMQNFLKIGLPALTRIGAAYEFFVNGDRAKGREMFELSKKQNASYPNLGVKRTEDAMAQRLEKLMEEV